MYYFLMHLYYFLQMLQHQDFLCPVDVNTMQNNKWPNASAFIQVDLCERWLTVEYFGKVTLLNRAIRYCCNICTI